MKKEVLKVFLGIVAGVYALAVVYFVIMPLSGQFAKKGNEIGRDVYESDPQYIKGIADDIAKYMYEYNTSNDENEKASIMQVVNHRFADVDLNVLNDLDLVNFVRMCRTGGN